MSEYVHLKLLSNFSDTLAKLTKFLLQVNIYKQSKGGSCQSVAMLFLECCGWLSGCCYAVVRVVCVVAFSVAVFFSCDIQVCIFIYHFIVLQVIIVSQLM